MIWNSRTDYTSTHTLRHIRPLSVHAHTLCELKKSWPVNFQFVPFVAYIPYACALSLPIYTTIPMRNERREREGDWVSERSIHFYCHLMNSNSWNDWISYNSPIRKMSENYTIRTTESLVIQNKKPHICSLCLIWVTLNGDPMYHRRHHHCLASITRYTMYQSRYI